METFVPKGKVYGPILPQFVLEKPISLGAKVMYALLCNYASDKDHCWPSQATLAAKLSCSLSSVKNYLGELVQSNLVAVRRVRCRSSVYYMLRPETVSPETKPNSTEVQPNFDRHEPKSGSLNTLTKQTKEKITPTAPTVSLPPKDQPLTEPPSAGGVSLSLFEFEKAWELYPKKEARGFAVMAWQKLAKGKQLPELSVLLSAIRQSTASEGWQKEGGRFVPQMGNWLRGQRWLDNASPDEDKKHKQREEWARIAQAYEAEIQRERAERQAANAKLKPQFSEFAAKFPDYCPDAAGPMVFASWVHLHSKGMAPAAGNVPPDNSLGIMEFLKIYPMRHAQSQAKRPEYPQTELKPCGAYLRHIPAVNRLFQDSGILQRAV